MPRPVPSPSWSARLSQPLLHLTCKEQSAPRNAGAKEHVAATPNKQIIRWRRRVGKREEGAGAYGEGGRRPEITRARCWDVAKSSAPPVQPPSPTLGFFLCSFVEAAIERNKITRAFSYGPHRNGTHESRASWLSRSSYRVFFSFFWICYSLI